MSEAQRRRVEAPGAALEMALTAALPGAGERTTVAAVLTAAVRAVVAAVAKRDGGCDVAAGKQVLPLLPWDDIEDWDDVGSDPEGAAEALVSSADAAELVEELYGPAESVMWCDDRGAGMTSSGLQGVSEFTHAGRVYFYEFGDIESIGDPGLWYAHDPGDDEARRAALVDAVGGIVGYGYGYLDTSIPDAPEVIAAAQRAAEGYDHAPWQTGVLDEILDEEDSPADAADRWEPLVAEACNVSDDEAAGIIRSLRRRRPRNDKERAAAWAMWREERG